MFNLMVNDFQTQTTKQQGDGEEMVMYDVIHVHACFMYILGISLVFFLL